MIVAVLGAHGQLGSDLVRAIEASEGKVKLVPLTRKDLDVTDLAAIPKVLARYEFDALVNCSSYHKTDEIEARATEAFLTNAHAVLALAKACKAKSAKFVHISTDYVFDGESRRPYIEGDATGPINVYGSSKLFGEKLALREYPDGTIIARVASLFGTAGASGKGGNFVEAILRKAKDTGEVRVVDDIYMSPTSTADAAEVLLALLRNRAQSGLYHVVNSGSASWYEFAKQMAEETGLAAHVVATTSREYPTVAARPAYSVLANGKAAAIAGELPHWRDALHRYLVAKGHTQPGAARAAGN